MHRALRAATLVTVTALGSIAPAFAQPAPPSSRPGCQDRDVPSFGAIFASTLSDFKRLPSRNTAGMLAVGTFATIASRSVDRGVSRNFSQQPLRNTFEAGQIVGGTPLQLGVAFATYGVSRAMSKPCAANLGVDLIRAQLLAETLTQSMKLSFRRSRPDGSRLSFPSGHTTVSFASATVLQRHYGWKVGLPAYAVASYVAASRVQMKRHYLSDVAFGAALGIAAGRTVTLGRGQHRFLVEPMAAPGGGGVTFSRIARP